MTASPEGIVVVLSLSTAAGATIPAGALLARVESLLPWWIETEVRHSVIAFGGGVLFAAIAFVLAPQGADAVPPFVAVAAFAGGGVAFFGLDRAIALHGRGAPQLMAMLLDFVPEAIALGALLAGGSTSALLLAFLIALQNLPEGFNAYREVVDKEPGRGSRTLGVFAVMALIGPAAALLGHLTLADRPGTVGVVMLFAAGGIMYLLFQDIAPQAKLERRWAPSLGAVAGFLLGFAGHLAVG